MTEPIPAAQLPAEGWKLVEIDRTYDQRVKALLAFNTAEQAGKDRDDALQLAWEAMLAVAPAAQPPLDTTMQESERPEWVDCESRGPMIRNSLKHQIEQLRVSEKRCRTSYTKPFMAEPWTYLADAYGEAAAALERRLSGIAKGKAP